MSFSCISLKSHILFSCHIQVQDIFPFSIGLSTDEGPINTVSNSTLFPKGHLFPSVKIIALHRSNTFNLETFYAGQHELPSGISPKISNFIVSMPLLSNFFISNMIEICPKNCNELVA